MKSIAQQINESASNVNDGTTGMNLTGLVNVCTVSDSKAESTVVIRGRTINLEANLIIL